MRTQFLYVDTETFSSTPVTSGTHAYTDAEDFEVMLFAYAIEGDSPQVLDLTEHEERAENLQSIYNLLSDQRYTIVFHNSAFDRTCIRKGLGIDIPVRRIHDTMIQAFAHGLPGKLDTLCDVFKLDADTAKDKGGKSLIHLFCKPQGKKAKIKRATRDTHPDKWRAFVAYAELDIISMRALHKKMPNWNLAAREGANALPFEQRLWELDQQINDRGFLVDTELAAAALKTVGELQIEMAARTNEITDGELESTNQRDALIRHILETFGIKLPNVRASTVRSFLENSDMPATVKELLETRLQSSTSSTSKYKKLLAAVSKDGRLRGTLQFCGAGRTGRWSGRLFQPQNLPRPTHDQDEIDMGIESIKSGAVDLIADDPMKLISSCIRGCIVAPEGKKLVISDLSNIEGRVAAWLAGEEWKLQAFRDYDAGTGPDLYKLAYAKAFDIHTDDVTKYQRQIGKTMELALGYAGGVGAFITFATAFSIDLDDMADAAWDSIPQAVMVDAQRALEWAKDQKRVYGLSDRAYVACDALKRMWRNAHPAVVDYWEQIDRCVFRAMASKGARVQCGSVIFLKDGSWLRLILPSGRSLCYAAPIMEGNKLSYMGQNQYTRKFERINTYSGKIFENLCQSVARDILAENMITADEHGYKSILSVHDETITEVPDVVTFNHQHLSALLSQKPEWARYLPLAAAGFETYRYRKD